MSEETENKPEVVSDFSTCRRCQAIKVRKCIGTFDGRNKRYVDEDGKLWNGRTCSSCHRHTVKIKTKERRANRSDDT